HGLYGGSPPRAWRRRRLRGYFQASQRFTSTRVETTRRAGVSGRASSVHLHARGDDGRVPESVRRARRFTSTRVETTSLAQAGARAMAVHLHARGDDVF